MLARPQSRHRKRAKPQAATKLVSQAAKNVSRRSLKLSLFTIISIIDNILRYCLTSMSKIYFAKKSTANSVITIFVVELT